MAIIGSPSSGASGRFTHPPRVEVYIDGYLRVDAQVMEVRQTSGWAASEATLVFENYSYPNRALPKGASVAIYINRHLDPRPKFLGFVSGNASSREGDSGGGASVKCRDWLARMNEDCLSYAYNMIDPLTLRPAEAVTAREIIDDIMNAYSTWAGSEGHAQRLILDAGFYPNGPVRELDLDGVPFLTALEVVSRTAQDAYRRRTRVRYRRDTLNPVLTMFEFGRGPVQNLNYETIAGLLPHQQPFYPNFSNLQYTEDDFGLVNRMKARGAPIQIQETLTLSPAWDATIEAVVLADPTTYTTEHLKGGENNPDYNPRAQWVGRRYRIPTVTWTNPRTGNLEARLPNLAGELLDADLEDATEFAPPVVAVKFAAEAQERVLLEEFRIERGRYVVFNKVQTQTEPQDATPGHTVELPTYVRLIASHYSPEVLEIDTGKRGNHWATTRNIQSAEDFYYSYVKNNSHRLGVTGNGVPQLTLVAGGDIVVEDDSAVLEDWAQSLLLELNTPDYTFNVECNHVPTHYEVGSRIRMNGFLFEEHAIVEISYFLGGGDMSGAKTILRISAS